MRRPSPSSPVWTLSIGAASLAGSLLIFYTVPISAVELDELGPLAIVLFVVGLVALLWVAALQIRRQIRAGSDPSVRVQSIVGLLAPFVVFFAGVYYALEVATPGSFVGISDRTDALYFTIVTLGTVGYGDVHPVGEWARIATMVQIVVDLVFIGAILSAATARVRGRAAMREDEHAQHPRGVDGPGGESN